MGVLDRFKLLLQVWSLLGEVKNMDSKVLKQSAAVFVGALVTALVAAFVPDAALNGSELSSSAVAAVLATLAFLKQSPIQP
jgi:hypothetical protein